MIVICFFTKHTNLLELEEFFVKVDKTNT